MSRPSVGSSSTSNLASIAMTSARCSCVTMPFDNSLTLLSQRIEVKQSQGIDFAFPADRGFPEKSFCFRAIESRMHAADIIERLRNPDPAWEHRHISDERNGAHEPVALVPGVASQHSQFSLIRSEAEDRVERGSLAGSVRTDKPVDTAL